MPCEDPGAYRESKDPYEAVKTLHEHHVRVERETEKLRKICAQQKKAIDIIRKMFPKIRIPHIDKIPEESGEWSPFEN